VRNYLVLLMVCGALLVAGACFAEGEGTAVVVSPMGIDWVTTIGNLVTALGSLIVAALGLWAGIKLVYVARRFISGCISGR
jgi:hypothetical protein